MVMGAKQFQTDMLLRSHYKYELIEKTKAQTDKLTGIDNRYRFDREIKLLLNNLKPGQYISLAMIDIDYFKKYNDLYGHLQGDNVLVEVAKLLSIQDADLVVRFGGEEFILVLVSENEREDWLSDLPLDFKYLNIPHQKSDVGYVSASLGVVTALKSDGSHMTKKQLLSAADNCLYQAKSAGRNRVCYQKL